jgi:hypothetical protein
MTYVRCSVGSDDLTRISLAGDEGLSVAEEGGAKFATAAQGVPQLPEPPMAAEEFKPKGAIAFFVALLLLYAVMWLSVYVEVLRRG